MGYFVLGNNLFTFIILLFGLYALIRSLFPKKENPTEFSFNNYHKYGDLGQNRRIFIIIGIILILWSLFHILWNQFSH